MLLTDIISSIFIDTILIIWWVMIPLFFVVELLKVWPDWLAVKHISKYKWSLLEIIPPPEVLKTPKAMESVLVGMAGGWSETNFRDKWWRGHVHDTFSLELVAHNGALRFFVRCRSEQVSWVSNKFYAEYPDAEIHETEDYAASLPEYVPNANWDMWGAEYTVVKPDWTLPIRTYLDWEDTDDDKRMSPLSQFGEIATQVGPYEYVMFQIIITPQVTEVRPKYEASIERITQRGKKEEKHGSLVGDVVYGLFEFAINGARTLLAQETVWKSPEEEENGKDDNLLFRLTPGEQDKLKAVEMKGSKINFEVGINGMYLFRRDHKRSDRISDMNGFIRQFSNENLNGLRPKSKTYPSGNASWFWWRKDKINLRRMRRLYFAYRSRWRVYCSGEPFTLNAEEIATLFHLPGQIVQTPSLGRIDSKTVPPPKELFS